MSENQYDALFNMREFVRSLIRKTAKQHDVSEKEAADALYEYTIQNEKEIKAIINRYKSSDLEEAEHENRQ